MFNDCITSNWLTYDKIVLPDGKYLYLGSVKLVREKFVKELCIDIIVSCSYSGYFYPHIYEDSALMLEEGTIEDYILINWDDDEDQVMPYDDVVDTTLPEQFVGIIEHKNLKFSEIVDKVYNLIQEDKIVAVHCQAGISRSVTFVASLLILKYSFENIDDVLKFISDQRPEADPNDEFRRFLVFLTT